MVFDFVGDFNLNTAQADFVYPRFWEPRPQRFKFRSLLCLLQRKIRKAAALDTAELEAEAAAAAAAAGPSGGDHGSRAERGSRAEKEERDRDAATKARRDR